MASKSDLDTTIFVVGKDFKFESMPSIYHRCIFTQDELEYNILDNIMVPKHQKVVDQKLEEIKDQLPIILSYDPVVRRMNFKPGDIIEIGSSYYRLVK
jgi:DNA-directed RNA polymerase subunit H (RpoH/RPB5)